MAAETTEVVLAADLGGTLIKMAAVRRNGEMLRRIERPTPQGETDDAIIETLAAMHSELSEAAGLSNAGMAMAAASIIDPENGIMTSSPNIPALNGSHLPRKLSEMIGAPVVLENDATAAAIGESWVGAATGYANSICLTLGTGVGGGIIIDGKVLRGPDGTAGEIGHSVIEHNGHLCGCGQLGCLEQYTSATAVVRMTKERLAEFPGSTLHAVAVLTSTDIYDAAVAGDALASEVFEKMAAYLGDGIVGLVNVFNPDIIVLAGGLSKAWPVFGERLRERIDKKAFRRPAERVKINPATLGSDAGILGAAKILFDADEKH
jgi:glucokinase